MSGHRMLARVRTLAVLAAVASLAPAAGAHANEGLSHRAAKRALERDLAERTMQAAFDAAFLGPVTITYDETGAQVATYAPVAGDGKLGACTRVSARRVRCDWRLWVTATSTGEIVARESGTNVARLVVRSRRSGRNPFPRHVEVSTWVPDARRRGIEP